MLSTRQRFRLVLVALAAWFVVSIPMALEFYDYAGERAASQPLAVLVLLQLVRFLPFALLIPTLYWLTATTRSEPVGFAVHALTFALYVVFGTAAFTLFELGMSDTIEAGIFSSYLQFLPGRLRYAPFVYAAVGGVARGVHFYNESQARRLEQAELERRLADAQLQALRNQLRPHFLFNTLHAISTLMEDDIPKARRMMAHLGELLRSSLKHEQAQEVALDEELRTLDTYLQIEKIRFADRLRVDETIDDNVRDLMVPPFVLQPIVENAIRHGISARSSAGTVKIDAKRVDDALRLCICDDGPGAPQKNFFEGTGTGLRNLRQRLEQLYGGAASVLVSSTDGGGVSVALTLPIREASEQTA